MKYNYIDPDILLLHLTKGNSLMGDYQILHKFAKNRKVKVEIGTAHGLSSMVLSQHGGKVFTIDNHLAYTGNFSSSHKSKIVSNYLSLYSNGSIVTIYNDSVAESEKWDNKSIDLLYIDGGHSYRQVKADYRAWIPKVKKDAVILFHDIHEDTPGVLQFYNKDIQKEIKMKRIRELVQTPDFKTVIKVFVKL